MTRCVIAPMLLLAGIASLFAAPAGAAGGDPSTRTMSIELDQTSVDLGIGKGFRFTSTITNDTDRPLTDLVAHLNIASADGSTYVDPEDWSSRRTQYVDALDPHATLRLSWNVHAVNSGELIIYVAVTTRSGPDVVVASGPLRATVTAIRSIDANSVLPVAVAVPSVLLAALGLAVRRRRQLT